MKKRSALVVAAGMATMLALAGCSSATGSAASGATPSSLSKAKIDKAMNTPTTLTFWDWAPGLTSEIAAFEKEYPRIKVNLVNAGQGGAEYTKLEAAIQAGKGAPDIVQLEYSELPSIVVTGALADLNQYGASSLKPLFTGGAWADVSANGGVWAVPQDQGPEIFMYRTDLLAKAGITKAPATWAEFAKDAALVKQKTGSAIADFGPTDPEQIVGMFQQAGATPFSYKGSKKVTIDLTSPKIKQVADYLTTLIQSGDVATDPAWTNDWYQGFAKGSYAGWVVGAWGPDDLTGSAGNTSGKWTVAPMPQWADGENSGGNWGGSSDAVLKTSKNPIAAYEFVKFLNSDPSSASQLTSNPKSALFPTTLHVLNSSTFLDQTADFFGGQKANAVFAEVSKSVKPGFEFPPFWNYAQSEWGDTVGKAITNHTDIYTAVKNWQSILISYGKQQGFTVN